MFIWRQVRPFCKIVPKPQNLHSIQEEAENTTTASTEFTIPLDYDTDVLRTELTQFGAPPGPIAATTKRLYLKRLVRFKHNPELVARQQAVQLQNGQNSGR